MKELSLHILDIAMNSVRADASILGIEIHENTDGDYLSIKITDNGFGMDDEMVKSVLDPFTTTRTTRKVGLGIPLFKANAENCNGNFSLSSKLNIGTKLIANFQLSNIDRPILGNISSVISMLFCSHPDIQISFTYKKDKKKYSLSSEEVKQELQGVSIQDLEIMKLVEEIIQSELDIISITD
jgi:DNA mismatch repair ATPase MutL